MTTKVRQVPAFDLSRQMAQLEPQLLEALRGVLRGTSFALGPQVEAFERDFAEWLGVSEVVALNSGTSALHLALLAAGVGPGDEVITTPWTFIATSWAISYVGARPVYVDVDDDTLCLDPSRLEAAITPRTKAVIPIHIYGQTADWGPIEAVCQARGLSLIEDAAQAHGARYQGRLAGALAPLACFSFYPTKNLGACGEGGAVSTSDPALAARMRALRNHAQATPGQHGEVGFNYRMEGFQGAVLHTKLPHLEAWNARRRQIAAAYLEGLAGLPGLRLPVEAPGRHHVYHQFVLRHARRDELRRQLQERGIGTAVHYLIPNHLQAAYAGLGYGRGSFPVAERAAGEVFSLPCFPELTDDEVAYVIATVRDLLA